MSWNIELQTKNGQVVKTDRIRKEGGTYSIFGTRNAELNVTYNYGKIFDFKEIDGLSAQEAFVVLAKAVCDLGCLEGPSVDYWKCTKGNVKKALLILLEFALYAIKNCIEAHFEVC